MFRPLPAFALLINAFVWGISWWPLRRLADAGVHPLWATAITYAIVLVALALLRPGAWAALLRMPQLWLLVLAAGLTNVGFNWAVATGDVVRVVLLFYLMPVWSLLLAWPLLGERPGPAALAQTALALGGVFAVLWVPGAGLPLPRGLPDWLAIGAGAAFALNNILLRRLDAVPAASRVIAMFVGGLLLASTAAVISQGLGRIAPVPPVAAHWLLVAAGLATAFLLGNLALQYGASRLRAHTTSLLMLSEVVFASVSSVLLGAAVIGLGTWAGGALVFAAACWSALSPRPTIAPSRHPDTP